MPGPLYGCLQMSQVLLVLVEDSELAEFAWFAFHVVSSLYALFAGFLRDIVPPRRPADLAISLLAAKPLGDLYGADPPLAPLRT